MRVEEIPFRDRSLGSKMGPMGQKQGRGAKTGAEANATATPDDAEHWIRTPARLQTLVAPQDLAPPVETNEQLLPFESLAWENFERLNLRLARRRGEVDHALDSVPVDSDRRGLSQVQAVAANLYGKRGQDQEGIDLYVRLPENEWSPDGTRRYLSLQSRRIAVLTDLKLRKAVDDFLAGAWASVSRVFVYAVSLSGVERKFNDEATSQRERLHALGIAFEVWDAEALSIQLKTEPRLVDDFFGRRWVERFLSPEAAAAMGTRLDASEVGQLRTDLSSFYTTFFDITDSGMAALQRADAPRVAFRERFVVPDVVAAVPNVPVSEVPPPPGPTTTPLQWYEQSEANLDLRVGGRPFRESAPSSASTTDHPSSSTPWLADVETRTGIDEWLSSSDRHLLIGGPGSGKSTFLRFALLDLLSQQPALPGWTARFGDRLPVWLPFHFFTRRRAYDDDRASVASTLKAWLEHNDGGHLWALVSKALEDDRLLLIVDGLDEWETEEAAGSASTVLETFLQQRGLPALFSTRPYGLRRIGLAGVWSRAELAPLSTVQQHSLARIWFTAAYPAFNDTVGKETGHHSEITALHLSRRVDEFTHELDASGDLRQRARVPLFLLLLVGLRMADVQLPRRRFEVYERVVDLFLRDHPAKRGAAASLAKPRFSLTDNQVRSVLAQTAFTHQERGDFGPVPDIQVKRVVIEALRNPYGCAMDEGQAAQVSEQFIQIAEGDLGVLVRQSHRELGFFHRALMEQLAAEYAVDYLGTDQLHALVTEHADDPRWSEVILAILWRLRPNQTPAAVDALAGRALPDGPAGMAATELLTEAVFGDFGLAAAHTRRHAARILDIIDTHPYVPMRQRLLKAALPGLRQQGLADQLLERLKRWTVAHQPVSPALLQALSKVISDERLPSPVWPVLTSALRSDDIAAVRAAAHALASRYALSNRQEETLDTLLDAVKCAPSAEHMSLILQQLIESWPDDQRVTGLIAHARSQRPLPLRLVGLAGALASTDRPQPSIEVPPITPEERDWLVSQLDSDDTSGNLWLPLLTHTLLAALTDTGQPREAVLDTCLEILDKDSDRYGDRHLAWAILLQGFANEARTVEFVSRTLRTDRPTISFLGIGPLAIAYPGHAQVAAEVDALLESDDFHTMDYELPALATISQSMSMRDYLLKSLGSSSTPHWAAAVLAKHWSADDKVTTALRVALLGEPQRASQTAQAAVPILGPRHALDRLLKLLDQPTSTIARQRLDIVTLALLDACEQLGITQGSQADRVATACLDSLMTFEHPVLGHGVEYEVMVRLHLSTPARTLANKLLAGPQAPLDAIAEAYPEDSDVIAKVLDVLKSTHPALPPAVRRTLHTLLIDTDADSSTIRDLTQHWPLESDDLARSAASAAYHTHLVLEQGNGTLPAAEWQQAMEVLRRYAPGQGFMSWGRQRSAWLGIMLTESLDLLPSQDSRAARLMLGEATKGADLLLLASIADCWPSLRAHFGAPPINRLMTEVDHGNENGAWGYLALVADREPSLATDLAAAVADTPGLLNQAGVLAWYANTHHGDPALLETIRQASLKDHFNVRPLANLLLADFRQLGLASASVRAQLHADLPTGVWRDFLPMRSSALEALADAFPGDEEVGRHWAMLTRIRTLGERVHMEPRTYFALVYGAVPAEDILTQIDRDMAYLETRSTFVEYQFTRSLVRRLRRDHDARVQMSKKIESQETSDAESAQLAAFLAAAGSLTDTTAASLHTRMAMQFERPAPDTIRDYCTSQNLPVPLLILRTLDTSLD